MTPTVKIILGDCLTELGKLPAESVHCCVTSPPYWGLRDYGVAGQIGLEKTPEDYVAVMVGVFREVRRVLREDGTLWLNLGSSYWGGGGFCETAPSTQFSKSGKYGLTGALIKGRANAASGGKRPNQSHSDAPACGNDGKELPCSKASDCACSCLCDECLIALGLSRNDCTCPIHGQSASPACTTNHDTGHLDCASSPPVASPPVAQESTMPQFSPQSRGGCLHCSNCGVCLSVLRSSKRDARLCVRRNSWVNNTIVQARFKSKDMVPIPWMVAMALQQDGWFLRSDVIWSKPNPMPESVTDRPTKSHEYLFLLAKSDRYFYDAEAIKDAPSETTHGNRREFRGGGSYTNNNSFNNSDCKPNRTPGNSSEAVISRNKRTVWTVATSPYSEAHFATFPPDLIKPCILAGTSAKGCCPKCGAPWERMVETKLIKQYECRHGGFHAKGTANGMVDLSETWSPGHNETKTIGWQPTCQHGEDPSEVRSPIPCTVIDPFGGSGTTGQVALELGRNAILIELNPQYVKLANDRTFTTPGLALA